MKEHYVNHVICHFIMLAEFDQLACHRWIEEAKYEQIIESIAKQSFQNYGFDTKDLYIDKVREIFEVLARGEAVEIKGDEYIGLYYYINIDKKDYLIQDLMTANLVSERIDLLGEDALMNAIKKIAIEDGFTKIENDSNDDNLLTHLEELDDKEVIPASNRIVKIDHNQQAELEEATNEVIEKIEEENSIDGDSDLRSRIIGQLKAGRELIRAGVFRAETLYLTLIVSLKLLIEKYKDHAIGATASKLIDLIHESIGSLV